MKCYCKPVFAADMESRELVAKQFYVGLGPLTTTNHSFLYCFVVCTVYKDEVLLDFTDQYIQQWVLWNHLVSSAVVSCFEDEPLPQNQWMSNMLWSMSKWKRISSKIFFTLSVRFV